MKWATGRCIVVTSIWLPLGFLFWFTFVANGNRLTLEQKNEKQTTEFTDRSDFNSGARQRLILPGQPPPENLFLRYALSIDPESEGYRASSWSDTAHLDHCDFKDVDWNDIFNFMSSAMPLDLVRRIPNKSMQLDAQHEMKLELLEIYASNHSRFCDFAHYKPTVTREADPESAAAILRKVPHVDKSSIRLAIAIVAYKDIEHLELLVQAIHLPQHYIIIHLERLTDPYFEEGVRELAKEYDNVVVLKFGSVVYKTSQLTDINLRIMRWLLFDSGLTFSYFLTMGGAVYPLYSASELAQTLQASGRKIFMGQLANNAAPRIARKLFGTIGLTYSRQNTKVYPLTASKSRAELDLPMRPEIMKMFDRKSNSGNQAIFDYDTVKTLLESADSMEIMATSKYGCCCCLEELVWYGVMNVIGLAEEALSIGSMLQFWSGLPQCNYTMSNALLTSEDTSCYLLGDYSARVQWNTSRVQGPYLQKYLVKAKEIGFLFARKFDSTDRGSVQLRMWIRKYLHPKHNGPYKLQN